MEEPHRNSHTPLSDDDKREAWRLHEQGVGVREIARRFGRQPSTISRFLIRERARAEGKVLPSRPRSARLRPAITPVRLERIERRIATVEALLAQVALALRPAVRRRLHR